MTPQLKAALEKLEEEGKCPKQVWTGDQWDNGYNIGESAENARMRKINSKLFSALKLAMEGLQAHCAGRLPCDACQTKSEVLAILEAKDV